MPRHPFNFYNLYHGNTHSVNRIVSKDDFTYVHTLEAIKSLEITNSRNKILDYGSGSGTISIFLASKGGFVTGVDISDRAVKAANKSSFKLGLKDRVKFYTLNKGMKIIDKNTYDIILCLEVIEHIKNDSKLMNLFYKHLKSNGSLILSTPSVNAPLYKFGLTSAFDQRVGHLRRYNLQQLEKLFSKSNFKIQSVRRVEGIIRNSLYVFPKLGFIIKFIRGPITYLVTLLDNLSAIVLGSSDYIIIATKK